jgi:hypothetical protein
VKRIVIVAGVCALLVFTPMWWTPPPPSIQRQNDSSFLHDYECWLRTGELPVQYPPGTDPLEAMVPR